MPDPIEPAATALLLRLADAGELAPEEYSARRTLSIYNHCRSEEEAATDTLSFRTLGSRHEYRIYLDEEDKFIALFAFLLRNGDIFYVDEHEPTALPLASWQQLLQHTTTGLREQQRFCFYIRRYGVLLASASDLHVAAYFLDAQHQQAFADLAAAYQLHLL